MRSYTAIICTAPHNLRAFDACRADGVVRRDGGDSKAVSNTADGDCHKNNVVLLKIEDNKLGRGRIWSRFLFVALVIVPLSFCWRKQILTERRRTMPLRTPV